MDTSKVGNSVVIKSEKSFPNICAFSEGLATKAPLMHQPGEQYTYSMGMDVLGCCLLYTSPSPRDRTRSRMPSSA